MQTSRNDQAELMDADSSGQLIYLGLQAGGAAYILSLALAQPIQYCVK